MPTYIALLRGINVSGQKKIKMSELKELIKSQGFDNVQTYIQSGNLIFSYTETEPQVLESKIKTAIAKAYGYDVEVFVTDRHEFLSIVESSPYSDDDRTDLKQLYYVFLMDPPDQEEAKKLNSETYAGEEFLITERCIFLNCFGGYGKAKCNNNFFEQRLNIRATTRNYNTVKTLLKLSG